MTEYKKINTHSPHAHRRGLTTEQAERSRREHGENRMTRKRQKSFLRQFAENLGDPVIRILLGALAVKLNFFHTNILIH